MNKRAAVLIVCLCAVLGCDKPETEKPKENAVVRAVPVQTIVAQSHDLSDAIISTSTVESRSTIDVLAEVPGVITQLEVDQGDTVRRKQKLARIKREELSFGVQTAQANVRRLKDEVSRLKPLYDKGIVSKQVYDEAAYALETAQSEQRRASSAAGDAVVRATSDGVVAMRYVTLGQQVATGTPMLRVVDPTDLIVNVNLPESVLGKSLDGRSVIIESDALPNLSFAGTVEKVSPVVDPRTGTVRITIALQATQNGQKLRPGMFVRTRIVTNQTNSIAVPRRAVLYSDNANHVFVVDGSTVRRTDVKTGLVDRDLIAVEGVPAGARVVVVGQDGLKDGTRVEPEDEAKPQSDI